MNVAHQLHAIQAIFNNARYPVARARFLNHLGISKTTLDRRFTQLREEYGWQITHSAEGAGGYVKAAGGEALEGEPGLVLTKDQLIGLALAYELLVNPEPTLLAKPLAPMRKKLAALMASEKLGAKEIPKRIRILRQSGRGAGKCFDAISHALLQRQQINILFNPRDGKPEAWRVVSPHRLTLYRDNWYLEAWCHTRGELRRFSVERITQTKPTTKAARPQSHKSLDAYFSATYGIFAGVPNATARLKFSPKQSQWVQHERWHASQVGTVLPDGSYQLDVPYSNETELTMDILKYGADVEVIAPEGLRLNVILALKAAQGKYVND